jgi:D-alanine-D-alanine ligase
MGKKRLGILFGGRSAEHEVSLQSAKNVADALDGGKFEPVLIGLDREGRWWLEKDATAPREPITTDLPVTIAPGNGRLMSLTDGSFVAAIDVVFPVLHGPFGEDGTVQGLLKLAGVPFVGCDVLGSAVGMDKDVMKRLLRDAGLPIGKYLVLRDTDKPDFDAAVASLGLPLFVKPANLGSSVGISKARNAEEFAAAVREAFRYDRKVVIEEFIDGREIECAVLGNDEPDASVPGEIIVNADFYSYEAKYLDENGAALRIPADLPPEKAREIQDLAVRVFKTLETSGLGRVDFFLKPDGTVIVNEINTMPGFTRISMFPRLWEASGLPYPELIDRLIGLAIERFEKGRRLETTRQ